MPDTDIRKRADEHACEVRRRLAFFLSSAMSADGVSYAALGEKLGISKNMVCRMLKAGSGKYENLHFETMTLLLEWLGLSWGDLDPKHIRPTQVGDVSQAIMGLDLDEDKRIKMRIIWETVYQAVKDL
jgi:hypothetical protein